MERYRAWHEPTERQKAAGNYRKSRLEFAGMEIAVENPAGSVRTGVGPGGEPWETRMVYPYGYIVGSTGVDGDPVDCYVGYNDSAQFVYVVHQRKAGAWDEYDEDKCMLGFDSLDSAISAYLLHYDDTRFLGDVTEIPISEFVRKVGLTKSKPSMIKSISLDGVSCGCADHALEALSKAISEDRHDIWKAHESPFISRLIEEFTKKGLDRLDSVQLELLLWVEGEKYVTHEQIPSPPGLMPVWTKDDLSLVKLYLESLPKEAWTLADYDYLVSYLTQRYLPQDELMTDAEWLSVKSNLLGKVQANLENVSQAAAEAISAALPSTVAGAITQFKLSDVEASVMEYGRLHAAEQVVELSNSARHQIKQVILNHKAAELAGDTNATAGKLQQTLFEKFDSLNRDWRRIALTESGEMANQGVIASLPIGSKVRRIEMYDGACGFCKKLHGRIYRVTTADDPEKDGDSDVWPGKTNYGRSASPRKMTDVGLVMRSPEEMWWAAAGVQHPHCRGRWEPEEALKPGDDAAFAAWMDDLVGKQGGMKLEEWSPMHKKA